MGLFSRLGTLIRSNINELINKAEDPEKMLNQVLVDMKQQLIEAKKQVAVAIADEKRIKKQWEQEAAKASEWEKKAMLAIRAGDDTLARAALARKADHDEVAGQLKDQWEAQKTSVENLKGALRGLDNKIEEAKRKRNLLVSRQKRAEAQRTINETLSSINSTSAFDTFDRMSDRVTQLEAEAEATSEIGALAESSLESQFKALEASSVDDQLEALKRKMALTAGKTEDPRQIGAGKAAAPPVDQAAAELKDAELDAQLEELKKKLSSS
ncbi:MAG: PspA/IM30 family protein [Nannocystis sp.]|nr:PspA/IM30 family protein [Nannocystis sp.]MBA3549007.1 PspA/IM30 family protein [Nannocystis sp.]